MADFADFETDEYGRPLAGVKVLVLDKFGNPAVLTGNAIQRINPLTTDANGRFAFSTDDGVYALESRYRGVMVRRDLVIVGTPPQYVGRMGNPGGNVMSIGPFLNADGIVVSAGVGRLATSGFASTAAGRADLVELPGRTLQGLGGVSRITTADNRVFGPPLNEEVTLDQVSYTGNAAVNLLAAFDTLQLGYRVSAERFPGRGVGRIVVGKGERTAGSTFEPDSPFGLSIIGTDIFSSVYNFTAAGGTAWRLRKYSGVHSSDMTIQAIGAATNSVGSVGIDMLSDGGGAEKFHLTRYQIIGFETAIRNSFDGNGDKSTFMCVEMVGVTGYTNDGNTQADGILFWGRTGAHNTVFRLGGTGKTLDIGATGNVIGAYVEYPEASGGVNRAARPDSFVSFGCKFEAHPTPGDPMQSALIYAKNSKNQADQGGSNSVSRFYDLEMTADPGDAPNYDTRVCIQVGDETDGNKGSDAIRYHMVGGWLPGKVRYNTLFAGANGFRSSFKDMVKAPDPAIAEFLGAGNHPLHEWRHNENVPVDQYRGGRGGTFSLDMKAHVFRPTGIGASELMRSDNTGQGAGTFVGPTGAIPAGQTRYGQVFPVNGFPPALPTRSAAVLITSNPGDAIAVEWFAADGTTLIANTVAPMGFTGLWEFMPSDWQPGMRPPKGGGVFRLSKGTAGQVAIGAVVLFYFPWAGV